MRHPDLLLSRSQVMSRIATVAAIALLAIAADWLTKIWAQETLFTVYNERGAAWWPVPALLGASAVLLIVNRDSLVVPALGLLTGGWVANVLERALFGPVTDFIPIRVLGRHYYANMADLVIVSGIALALVVMVRTVARERARVRATAAETALPESAP